MQLISTRLAIQLVSYDARGGRGVIGGSGGARMAEKGP
jgi:hypothetical protein